MIFIYFENVRGALEMTAHVGKGLRKGSRAEPGHWRVDYAHVSENHSFRVEKRCRMHPRACFWAPGPIFDMIFWVWEGFGAGVWGVGG